MDINKEKRLEMYRQSPVEIQDLYGSVETGRIIRESEERLNVISEESKTIFALAIGDVILGLYKKDLLGQLFRDRLHFSDQQIETALNSLRELTEKIPNDNKESTPPVFTATIPENITASDNTTAKEGLIADSPLIKPLRTFANDVGLSRAHGYGAFRSSDNQEKTDDDVTHRSSQDDIIKQ